ncbi:hypothetical protein [Microvirga sp. VF16]|uniref:hypothetical protein n=1 Tax=Microvirga sp. VF16 TaxID=2807101 RepID=UPI00193C92E2|nr:hypothetical protein JO965_23160 [Microvirga sp. VF16]
MPCAGAVANGLSSAHLAGVVGAAGPARSAPTDIVVAPALLRPLAEFEALVGGGW